MELNRLSWETFTRTGDIDAYLLYKTVSGITEQEDKDDTWQKLEQEALVIKQSDYGEEEHRDADCIYGRIRDS